MANNLCPVVKKALSKRYGAKNVSVKNGQGTAWGWVEARITIPDLYKDMKQTIGEAPTTKRTINNEASKEAKEIAKWAVKKAGLEFYTYTNDGEYGDHDCFLLSIC